MVSSGLKIPNKVNEVAKDVKQKLLGAVLVDLDSKSNTLYIRKTYSPKLKHPFRACLNDFDNTKASFAMINLKLCTTELHKREKLIVVIWIPREATTRVKMIAASGFEVIRRKFSDCNAIIEIFEKTFDKNIDDILSKTMKIREGCSSIEGVPVKMNEVNEYVFADDLNHDNSDFEEEE